MFALAALGGASPAGVAREEAFLALTSLVEKAEYVGEEGDDALEEKVEEQDGASAAEEAVEDEHDFA